MIAIVEFGEDFRFSSFWRRQIKARRHNRTGIVVRDARRTTAPLGVGKGRSLRRNFSIYLGIDLVPALHIIEVGVVYSPYHTPQVCEK